MKIAHAILALVVLQRVAELWYASKNTTALKARGGVEYGRRHYPLIVAVHASWLITVAIGIRCDPEGSEVRILIVSGLEVLPGAGSH